MNTVKDSMETVTSWIKSSTELGLSIILAFVMIDVLFPGSTGVVNNIGTIVAQFSKEGLTSLIALLMIFFPSYPPKS